MAKIAQILGNIADDDEQTAARARLFRIRWPSGFRCPRCNESKYYPMKDGHFTCLQCRYQSSVTSGTLLGHCRLPPEIITRAAELLFSVETGISTAAIASTLGVRYASVYRLVTLFRAAMAPSAGDKLTGTIAGIIKRLQMPGDKPAAHVLVVAMNWSPHRGGKLRLLHIADGSAATAQDYVKRHVSFKSVLRIRDDILFDTIKNSTQYSVTIADVGTHPGWFKRCDRAYAIFCNGLESVYRGAVREEALQSYLDEWAFRIDHEKFAVDELLKRLLDNSAYRQSGREIRL